MNETHLCKSIILILLKFVCIYNLTLRHTYIQLGAYLKLLITIETYLMYNIH